MSRVHTASLPALAIFDGSYEILEEIGEGSFGRVFKARQQSTGQLVALKLLRWGTEDPDAQSARQFQAEMRLCAGLSHPNIVPLVDAGETTNGLLYVAFAFLPGTSLRDVLSSEGKLDVPETIHLMGQVLDALACAHARGVVHRDLKPENIVVAKTGARRNAMVLDFGLGGLAGEAAARAQGEASPDDELLGTVCYAAPEQLRGEAPSPGSDFYSWGLTLLECLTGESPFGKATGPGVVLRQLGPEPVAIPPWLRNHPLGRVLEIALAKQPEKRAVSADKLLRLLTDGGAGEVAARAGSYPDEVQVARERRQLTVVCCRLTVTTQSGRQPDIEEVDGALQAQLCALAERTVQAGGVMANILGDRVLLLFGYPHAREDDARHAARLAMALVKDAAVAPGSDLRLEVGAAVHTGIILVPAVPPVTSGRVEVTGSTPQVASELVQQARPGEVLVTLDTHRLLRREFDSEPLPGRPDGSGSGKASAFRLTGLHREATDADDDTTAWVGRDSQLRQLSDGWAKACAGEGSVVIITGEPGIGKSRLVLELRRQVGPQPWVDLACAPENQSTPLRPVIDALQVMDQSIAALLRRFGIDLAQNLPLFAALLSAPLDEGYEPLSLSPERQKELTLQALVHLVLAMAAQSPVVLALENLHWADPTTIELMTLLIRELGETRRGRPESRPKLYIVLTTRPELIPPWSGEGIAFLPLPRLAPAEVQAMVGASLAGDELPAAVVEEVMQRAEGVPLFVEEITRVVLESTRKSGAVPDPSRLAIPGSVRDLLTARLDGVAPGARETAQLAAVLGREFRCELLQAASPKDAAFVRQDLAELGRAGLVVQRRVGSTESYAFRHALLRDAAYEAMTRSKRQGLHVRVAHVLADTFPDVERNRPEILALHFEQGGEAARAVDYWSRAGNNSYRRAAYAEAMTQVERALSLVASLQRTPENLRREVEALVAQGTTLLATRGWAVPEVEQTFARALNLCGELGGAPPFMVLYGVWGVRITRSDRAGIEELLPHLQALSVQGGDPQFAQFGPSSLGVAAFWRGDFVNADRYLEQALRPYRENSRGDLAYDGGLYTMAFRFVTLWALGHPDRAEALRVEAFGIAGKRRDPYSLALVLAFGAILARERGDLALARDWAEQTMAIATEQRLFAWWAPGAVHYGHAKVVEGDVDGGLALIRQGLERYRMLGVMCSYAFYLPYFASACLEAGRPGEAQAVIEEGLDLSRTLMARCYESELLRLRGELLRQQGQVETAEGSFRQALAMAERDGARSYALRTALGLGCLLRDSGREAEARAVVGRQYDQFTEGFDTQDLKMAAAFCAVGR